MEMTTSRCFSFSCKSVGFQISRSYTPPNLPYDIHGLFASICSLLYLGFDIRGGMNIKKNPRSADQVKLIFCAWCKFFLCFWSLIFQNCNLFCLFFNVCCSSSNFSKCLLGSFILADVSTFSSLLINIIIINFTSLDSKYDLVFYFIVRFNL